MSLPTLRNSVEKLQMALQAKAKAEPIYRFYSLWDKVYRQDVLWDAYRHCHANDGAPGVDGVTFDQIEAQGVEAWLAKLRGELRSKTYVCRSPAEDYRGHACHQTDGGVLPRQLRKGGAAMSDVQVEITFTPDKTGSTKGVLTARQGDTVLHHDRMDIAKDRQRTAFLNKLQERCPSIEAAAIRQLLLDEACRAAQASQTPSEPPAELDVSRIVRPHLFHVPEVSGLLIPVAQARGKERPEGRWLLCIQWADGRRECIDLDDYLDVDHDKRIWFSQKLPAPLPTTISRWSRHSRAKWLNGYMPKLDDIFRRVFNLFLDYLEFPSGETVGVVSTLSLWTMLTYAYPVWPAVPYLSIGGPLGSGKSRVFDVLVLLAFNPLPSSNLTAACLFRTLHAQAGTLLLDEAERLRDKAPDVGELLSILLAGYKRGGQATRLDKVDDNYLPTFFDVFGPKAIAGISSMPAALASRCIKIMMFRAGKDSPVPKRRIDPMASVWTDLRDDLHCMALAYGTRLTAMAGWQPDCAHLNGRNLELWLPILAMAKLVEEAGMGGLVEEVERHALKCIDVAHEDTIPELDEVLLRTLKQMLEDKAWGVSPGELLQMVKEEESSLCAQYTPRGISTILNRYGIKTGRTGGKRLLKVSEEQWKAIEESYGIGFRFDGSDETNGNK